MTYDFITLPDRRGQGAAKYELIYEQQPELAQRPEPLVPLTVADMDFVQAPEIVSALKERLQTGVLGYTKATKEYEDAVISWMKTRHNFSVKRESLVYTPGVVTAFYLAIEAVSESGDGVIIMPPVYTPFFNAVEHLERKLVECPLRETEGYYEIDFELLAQQAQEPQTKILLFCSPHNPVGRVWQRAELERLAEIVLAHDLYLISDEIHHDLVYAPNEHIVSETISPELAERCFTLTAASKSFNLAGLGLSNVIISNSKLREKFEATQARYTASPSTALGWLATQVAYTEGTAWLAACLNVLEDNARLVKNFCEEHFSQIKVHLPEATYLLWLDFRAYGLSEERLLEKLASQGVFLKSGLSYGVAGKGFLRMNIALPQAELQKYLEQMKKALA